MFFRTPFFLPVLFPRLLWRIPTQEKQIYLTFDDGPVPGPTEFVLDTLKKFGAKATFFCIGDNIRKHPIIFSRIIEEGHSIGNHTFNHLKGWSYSTKDYMLNIELCNDQMEAANSGQSTVDQKLFRPPYGRITLNQIKSLEDNYRIIMWDVLSQDYDRSVSSDSCLNGSIKSTRTGSIVVFHDSLKAERNLTYTLPRYLEHFSNLDYIFSML
ncbi:MAG: polysaccharide deacetylase family protein [Flammeovirgaceae bacterium]|nr:polysaccharide deacetylase family protein [Flammeovirgaceae bacterium]